jgi:hypothetical protein
MRDCIESRMIFTIYLSTYLPTYLSDRNWVHLEVNFETAFEHIRRCTWRLNSRLLGDALRA